MLTGTPLDLTVIPELLAWLGKVIPVVWLLLLVAGLTLAWKRARTRLNRALGVTTVLALLVVAPLLMLNELRKQALADRAKQEAQQAEFKAQFAKAEALFKKRCETAGEFIRETVPNVEGVVWMKWRKSGSRDAGQFELIDPVGYSCTAMECIDALLQPRKYKPASVSRPDDRQWFGFKFVEAYDPVDGKLYRYRLAEPSSTTQWTGRAIQRTSIDTASARYGIRWDDISTREERENWIAAGSLSVVDLSTNEILGVRIRYAMDPGLGRTEGFRSPWGFAMQHACPAFPGTPDNSSVVRWATEDYEFATKVLQPSTEE